MNPFYIFLSFCVEMRFVFDFYMIASVLHQFSMYSDLLF